MTDRRDFIRSLGSAVPAWAALPFAFGSPSRHSDLKPPCGGEPLAGGEAGIRDVRAFGARGDGESDDTRAIQSAIDERPDEAAIVYFPSGTYRHTGLTVQSSPGAVGSRLLVGSGMQSRLLHAAEGPSFRVSLVGKPGTIEFRSLHIDGGGPQSTHGIMFDRTKTVVAVVRDCALRRHGLCGIYSLDSWHTRVVNCLIVRNGEAGVWLSGSNGPYLWANTIERNRIGVKVGAGADEYEGASNRRVQGGRLAGMNIIQSNDEVGILLRGVEGVSVTGNYFEGNSVGIRQEPSTINIGSTISENRFNVSERGCAVEVLGGHHTEVRSNTVVGGGGSDDVAYRFEDVGRDFSFQRGYIASTISTNVVSDGTGLPVGGRKGELEASVRDNRQRISEIERALRKYGVLDG